MARAVALIAEVFGGAHQSLAKEGLPLAVDGDSGRQRIVGGHQPAGKAQTVPRQSRRQLSDRGEGPRFHPIGGLQVFAAAMEKGGSRIARWAFLHHQGGFRSRTLAQLGDALLRLPEFGCGQQEVAAKL